MFTNIRTAILLFLLFTLLTGFVYPFAVTGVARSLFCYASGGSIIIQNGRPVGSELIGQLFTDPRYFSGRPSSTSPDPYTSYDRKTGAASAGSNLAPSNPQLLKIIRERVKLLKSTNPGMASPPVDLVTSSASGLDPEISVAAAKYQIPRVAASRGVAVDIIEKLVGEHTLPRQFGFLGEPRVRVLPLNLALDLLSKK